MHVSVTKPIFLHCIDPSILLGVLHGALASAFIEVMQPHRRLSRALSEVYQPGAGKYACACASHKHSRLSHTVITYLHELVAGVTVVNDGEI